MVSIFLWKRTSSRISVQCYWWFAPICPTLPIGFAKVDRDVSEMVSECLFTQTSPVGLWILKSRLNCSYKKKKKTKKWTKKNHQENKSLGAYVSDYINCILFGLEFCSGNNSSEHIHVCVLGRVLLKNDNSFRGIVLELTFEHLWYRKWRWETCPCVHQLLIICLFSSQLLSIVEYLSP